MMEMGRAGGYAMTWKTGRDGAVHVSGSARVASGVEYNLSLVKKCENVYAVVNNCT
jgi:hypothetical protein